MGKDHTAYGRSRHPWLTGSAGWAYTAATKWILGIRPDFAKLVIDPCIPRTWKGFEVTRKWRGATFKITVKNPDGVEKGVRSILVDGKAVNGTISSEKLGSFHVVDVTMGGAEPDGDKQKKKGTEIAYGV